VFIAVASARASLYTETVSSGGGVGPISGVVPLGTSFTQNINDASAGDTVIGLTVSLNISFTSGSYGNGSLYAYLASPNQTLVQLFGSQSDGQTYGIGGSVNNPFGNSGSGLNVTLADSAAASIQNAQDGPITGTYQAVGSLSAMNGSSVNGNWTLFIAYTQSGSPAGTLNAWSLGITAVPEPITQALIMFGVIYLLIHSGRLCWRRWRSRLARQIE
jgi:hypothetical protein